MNPRRTHYTNTAIALHWVSALLIAGGFVLGLTMVDLPVSPRKLQWYSYHKWIGVTVFGLVCLRLLWRLRHPVPLAPSGMRPWQRHVAGVTHWALYVLLFLIPLSGWLYSSASGYPVVYLGIKALQLPDLVHKGKAMAQVLRLVHELLNYTLLGLVLVHAGAALKHHFIDDDDVLRRMLPRRAVRSKARDESSCVAIDE